MGSKSRDLGPDELVEILERAELDVERLPGLLREASPKLRLVRPEQPAAGVADNEDLVRSEELLADDERADRVVAREPARVSDDVGVTGPEPESLLDVEPSVHARKNR